MKKIIILCLFALTFVGVYAQKNTKAKKLDPATMLQSSTDSLAYALGQNMTAGLKQHLMGIGVLKDTVADSLIKDYTNKFEKASAEEKKKLEKELATKRNEVEKANAKNEDEFIKGLAEALNYDEVNSYNAGIGIGNQLSDVVRKFEKELLDGNSLGKEIYSYSITSALKGDKSIIEAPEAFFQKKIVQLQAENEIKQAEKLKELHGDRITSNTKFFAANKAKVDVTTLPSGLQYKIITEGTGAIPEPTDRVTVHYEGRLLEDGTVFDSSYERGEPATFGVTQVIKGWIEALQLMPMGSKWTIYVPYDLAYGSKGTGEAIPPFSALEFDIELISIEK